MYIGETESLAQRLKQHRQFYQRASNKQNTLTCLAFNVDNKSQARLWETKLIQYFKAQGEVFVHDTDVAHSLFSRGLV